MAIAEVPAAQRRLTELTLEFLGTLELERGLSRNTVEAYRRDLLKFETDNKPHAERAQRMIQEIDRLKQGALLSNQYLIPTGPFRLVISLYQSGRP